MLEIIARDQWLIAINKPAGLLVHRSGMDPRETRHAVQEVRNQVDAHVHADHHLDQPPSCKRAAARMHCRMSGSRRRPFRTKRGLQLPRSRYSTVVTTRTVLSRCRSSCTPGA